MNDRDISTAARYRGQAMAVRVECGCWDKPLTAATRPM